MSLAGFMLAGMLLASEGVAQPSPANGGRLKVFLDCSNSNCFEGYLREEVEIVNTCVTATTRTSTSWSRAPKPGHAGVSTR